MKSYNTLWWKCDENSKTWNCHWRARRVGWNQDTMKRTAFYVEKQCTHTQWCRFLSQEVSEISRFFVAPPTRVRPRPPRDISRAKFKFLLINLQHWVCCYLLHDRNAAFDLIDHSTHPLLTIVLIVGVIGPRLMGHVGFPNFFGSRELQLLRLNAYWVTLGHRAKRKRSDLTLALRSDLTLAPYTIFRYSRWLSG